MRAIRDLIKNQLLRRDMILSRPPGQFDITALKLRKARDRGLKVATAVDGGAAEGLWTRQLKTIWPDAGVLCVEPREDTQPALRQLAREMPGVTVAQTLLGDREGEVEFYVHRDQSSMLPDAQGREWGEKRRAPITTLDALLAKLNLPDPDLLKLDLQGAELDCLRGASRCLAAAEAVLLEVSLIELQKGMPLMADVIPFMAQRGFRVYDILSLWHRPLDGALAQGDFLFAAERSGLLADTRWSGA